MAVKQLPAVHRIAEAVFFGADDLLGAAGGEKLEGAFVDDGGDFRGWFRAVFHQNLAGLNGTCEDIAYLRIVEFIAADERQLPQWLPSGQRHADIALQDVERQRHVERLLVACLRQKACARIVFKDGEFAVVDERAVGLHVRVRRAEAADAIALRREEEVHVRRFDEPPGGVVAAAIDAVVEISIFHMVAVVAADELRVVAGLLDGFGDAVDAIGHGVVVEAVIEDGVFVGDGIAEETAVRAGSGFGRRNRGDGGAVLFGVGLEIVQRVRVVIREVGRVGVPALPFTGRAAHQVIEDGTWSEELFAMGDKSGDGASRVRLIVGIGEGDGRHVVGNGFAILLMGHTFGIRLFIPWTWMAPNVEAEHGIRKTLRQHGQIRIDDRKIILVWPNPPTA